MLTSSLKSAFVAGAIALGAITTTAATTTAAQAGDVRFGVQIGGPGYGIHIGNRDRGYRRHPASVTDVDVADPSCRRHGQ